MRDQVFILVKTKACKGSGMVLKMGEQFPGDLFGFERIGAFLLEFPARNVFEHMKAATADPAQVRLFRSCLEQPGQRQKPFFRLTLKPKIEDHIDIEDQILHRQYFSAKASEKAFLSSSTLAGGRFRCKCPVIRRI